MARKRVIDPSLWEDEELMSCSAQAFKLFMGLVGNADDYGRIRADHRYLKRLIFGFNDHVTTADVEKYLLELDRALRGLVVYIVDGRQFVCLLRWGKHQKLTKPVPSNIPEPPGYTWVVAKKTDQYERGDYQITSKADNNTLVANECTTEEQPLSASCDTSYQLVSNQLVQERKGKEKKEKEKNKSAATAASETVLQPSEHTRAHPGVTAFRDVMFRNPLKEYYEALDREYAILGDHEFRQRLLWWKGRGWNPANYAGIVEVLRRGTDYTRNQREATKPDPFAGAL